MSLMCVRMHSLAVEEAQAVLDAHRTPGAQAIRHIERIDLLHGIRPGSLEPVRPPTTSAFPSCTSREKSRSAAKSAPS